MDKLDRLLTPEEAADILVVSPNTVRHWLRTGTLKGIKVGLQWRIRKSDLEEFIKGDDEDFDGNIESED